MSVRARERPLSILGVGYPCAPVSLDAVGGAEQVLAILDRELTEMGHVSTVISCEGSRVRGQLFTTPLPAGSLDDASRRRAQAWCGQAIASVLRETKPDVVHLHGVDFASYLPPEGAAVLATLHLPSSFYPADVFALRRRRTYLNCVSATQRRTCPNVPAMLANVANGVR